MDYIVLSNGSIMPAVGYGVDCSESDDCGRCVSEALETGYRMIDITSPNYSPDAVGHAIQMSGIPRRELFITAKAWRCGSETLIKEDFRRTLDALHLDYVDLYLVQYPYGDLYATWRAMAELSTSGLIKEIGVCNFSEARIADLCVNNRVSPSVCQIEVNPFMQRRASLAFLVDNHIYPQALRPLSKNYTRLYENDTLRKVAQVHEKTVSQVVLRWHWQNGITCIINGRSRSHMFESINIFDFELSEREMAYIDELDERNVPKLNESPASIKAICKSWNTNSD